MAGRVLFASLTEPASGLRPAGYDRISRDEADRIDRPFHRKGFPLALPAGWPP